MMRGSWRSGGLLRTLCLAALLAVSPLPTAVHALNPAVAVTQYSLRAWLSDESDSALPQNSVFSIVQTRDGYLWLATQEGVVRFDGQSFTVFNKRSTPQILHNDVWKLLEARDGSLWIGTRGGGLTRYKDGVFSTLTKDDGLASNAIQALWEDRSGALWIGTRGGGLTRYRDGGFATFTTADGLANDTVFAIAEDSAGTLWIGTDGGGLSRYRDGRFSTLSVADGLSNATVYAIVEDKAGSLWIGTGAGLNRIANGIITVFRTADGLSNDNVRALHEDRAGNLWIGTDGGGLNRYRDGRFSALSTKDGLSNDSVGSIYEDREGNLWVGTDAGGVNRLKDSKFVSYTSREGLSDDNARVVLEDRDGSLWIGTFGGLNRFEHGRFTVFTTRNGLSTDTVLSLLQTRNGDLWIGTLGGGVNRYRDGRFTAYSSKDGLANDTVLSLCEDRQGAIWMGTRSGGLARYEQERFRVYSTKDGLAGDDVRVIREDRQGTLWIGTLGGGLSSYRDGTFTTYSVKDGLSDDKVLEIYEDADGVLWIGTFGGGLNRFKDGKFFAFRQSDGLFDDSVFRILEDGSGNLWMSSNHGIFRVSRQSLNDFADGKTGSIASVSYGTADGLRSAESNGAHQPAGWKTRDGRLWFPTIRGVASIDPEHITTNRLPPPVLIERFAIDGSAMAMSGPIEVPPGRRTLDFRYTALSYPAPEKMQFRYKLEGFDEDWVPAGTLRSARYTNVPHGRYRFRVIASNNDGVWNTTGADVGFYLQPHFYQRHGFYLVYLAAFGLALALAMHLHRLRVRQLETRARELLTLVNERNQAAHALTAANRALELRVAELTRPAAPGAGSAAAGNPPIALDSAAHDDAMDKRLDDFNRTLARLTQIESELQRTRDTLAQEVEQKAQANRELERTLQRLTETQARLIQSEKLASLGVLVVGMAHEINTPVGVGVTAASLLSAEATQFRALYGTTSLKRSDLDHFIDTAERSGQIILRNLQRAADMIESFKQVSVDQTSGERRRFAMDVHINEVLNTFASRLKESGHTVVVDCPAWLMVDSFPGALTQILTNLLSNSLLHAYPDGRSGTIRIGVSEGGGTVLLRYADDGIGVLEEHQGRVYDPFFTTRRGTGGSGLGLHIVYNLVTLLLGGTIELISRPGEGTLFEIRFPTAPPGAAA